jgi:NAD(P)-dependent dehydrogenase (short-subunit alcohol dehydrogenase family)
MAGNVDAPPPPEPTAAPGGRSGTDEPWAGWVAVVTGASRGIGAGLAARFAERGLALGLCARSAPAVPAGAGARTLVASVDVTDGTAVEDFADAVVDRFGRIDLWVNNAGVLAPIGPLRAAPADQLEAHVRINVVGVLLGSRAYARHVRSRPGGGALVNISSGAATNPYAGWAAYCGAKAAVDQLTRVVAIEEADAGLRALAVAPGVVDTDMQAAIRATPREDFPSLDRFLGLAKDDAFNSPAWVADRILDLAVGATPEGADGARDVVVRIPDEPRNR